MKKTHKQESEDKPVYGLITDKTRTALIHAVRSAMASIVVAIQAARIDIIGKREASFTDGREIMRQVKGILLKESVLKDLSVTEASMTVMLSQAKRKAGLPMGKQNSSEASARTPKENHTVTLDFRGKEEVVLQNLQAVFVNLFAGIHKDVLEEAIRRALEIVAKRKAARASVKVALEATRAQVKASKVA